LIFADVRPPATSSQQQPSPPWQSPASLCAAASIAALPPLSPRQCLSHHASLTPAVGCCIAASLATPAPLLPCRRLSRCAATSLIVPPPLLRALLASAGCRFATYLDVLPSLLSRRLVVALSPLFLCRGLFLCHISHRARSSQPQLKTYRLARGALFY
jgi:hypothetical protein